MEKRATVIDSIRQANPNVLLLDAGDLFSSRPQPWRNQHIVEAYRLMHYNGIALGEKDFVEGPEFLMSRLFALGNIINTNIQFLGLTFGQPYKIFTFDSVKIGVTAIFDSSLAGLVWIKSKGKFVFKNPEPGLKEVLPRLKKECDFIILLAHGNLTQMRKFVNRFPEINLVVNGHSQQLLEQPILDGNTYFLQTDGEAYRLGKATLRFREGHLISLKNEMILLDDSIPNHPKMMELIRLYRFGQKKK